MRDVAAKALMSYEAAYEQGREIAAHFANDLSIVLEKLPEESRQGVF